MRTAPEEDTHTSQGSARTRRPARPPADEDARRERLEQFHARLSEQVLSLTSSTAWTDWLRTAARFHSYSFRNTVAIWSQRPDASQVAGYRVWQAMGRQVRKGERGIEILAPVTRRVEDDDAEAGARARPGGGAHRSSAAAVKEPGTLPPPRKLVGYRIAHVFEILQTDPIPGSPPLPGADAAHPTLLTGQAPENLWDALARQVDEAGFRLALETPPGAANGLTSWAERHVLVRPELEDAQRVKTLAHELGHIALHEPDDVLDLAALACRGQKEVEAESVAFLVTSANGMDTSAYSFAYVAGWAQQAGGDIEATLADTATRALGAAHRILDRLDRDNPAALPVAEDAVPFEISGPLRAAPVPSAPADHSRHPTPSPGAADIAQAHRGVGR